MEVQVFLVWVKVYSPKECPLAGVFSTKELAEEYADELSEYDANLRVSVGSVGMDSPLLQLYRSAK